MMKTEVIRRWLKEHAIDDACYWIADLVRDAIETECGVLVSTSLVCKVQRELRYDEAAPVILPFRN